MNTAKRLKNLFPNLGISAERNYYHDWGRPPIKYGETERYLWEGPVDYVPPEPEAPKVKQSLSGQLGLAGVILGFRLIVHGTIVLVILSIILIAYHYWG